MNCRYGVVDMDGEIVVIDRETKQVYSETNFKRRVKKKITVIKKDGKGNVSEKVMDLAKVWFDCGDSGVLHLPAPIPDGTHGRG